MLRVHNSIPIHFSPRQYAAVWFSLAAVFLSLAGGAYYWHENSQYHLYMIVGLVMVVLGIATLLLRAFQGEAK